jgi:preprotein translocase subunit SecE
MQAKELQHREEQEEHHGTSRAEQVLPFLPEAHRAYGNEVRQEGKTVAKDKNAKPNWFQRAWKAISNWFRGMKSELKKVVWPSRKTTTKNVLVAVTVMVISGIVIWAFDQVAMLVVQTLISIGH